VPHPDALLAREPDGVLETILEPRQPVGQRLGVVGGESLDVLDGESGMLKADRIRERCSGAASGNT
jgi:hypothetical protein